MVLEFVKYIYCVQNVTYTAEQIKGPRQRASPNFWENCHSFYIDHEEDTATSIVYMYQRI